MKKTILIVLALIWIASLIILIIALTDLVQVNPFKNYRWIIGIGFLTISGFVRKAYQNFNNPN